MDYPKDSLAGAKATRANSKAGVTPVLILCDNSGSMSGWGQLKHKISFVNLYAHLLIVVSDYE